MTTIYTIYNTEGYSNDQLISLNNQAIMALTEAKIPVSESDANDLDLADEWKSIVERVQQKDVDNP